ncbi:ComF family protein [Candidatus Saccharibacteria bacterium]|nr:ComF family protein [Candidatus Saccharibacteria bacterium]
MKIREMAKGADGSNAFFLGYRDEFLGELIEEAKYESVRGLIAEIAEVIYRGYFEKVEGDMLLVPMPTSRRHVRERAMDHMDMIAKEIERLSKGRIQRERLLVRAKDTVQTGASESVRRKQAKEAVRINEKYCDEDGLILKKYRDERVVLIDDVWTTGSSLIEAGKILKKSGVNNLSLIAITKSRARRSPTIRHGEIY